MPTGQINWVEAAGLALILANVLAISEKNESCRPRLAQMNWFDPLMSDNPYCLSLASLHSHSIRRSRERSRVTCM